MIARPFEASVVSKMSISASRLTGALVCSVMVPAMSGSTT